MKPRAGADCPGPHRFAVEAAGVIIPPDEPDGGETMRTIETTGVVAADHTLTVAVPADIPPGAVRVVVVIENGVPPGTRSFPESLILHNVGPWPEGFTVSREQIYGDDGR